MTYNAVNLFDDRLRDQLLPLTFTKPTALLRTGALTNAERWKVLGGLATGFLTEDYLSGKFKPLNTTLFINGRYLASEDLLAEVGELADGEALFDGEELVAFDPGRPVSSAPELFELASEANRKSCRFVHSSVLFTYDLFSMNDKVIRNDIALLTKGRTSAKVSGTNTIIGDDLFVEEGASLEACTINTLSGPVYIGKDAEVMEGSMIRGPFVLGDHSTLKLGTKIYGATTIGPHCKVGGEVNNSIISGYSNKAHDGFLGNSVIGEWCNLGADTNNSNLKNNYAEVKLYHYPTQRFAKTGLQFCGLIMGDHSKCGINTMFNTGTVVGVNANIFGSGFPRNYIPSFSWGGAAGMTTYKLEDALKVAHAVMERRSLTLTAEDEHILTYIHTITEKNRA
jgi:UDP-N-acetylglucosamine diphosphorylase/glucosamine-1-phosphate N-acetyltransferase